MLTLKTQVLGQPLDKQSKNAAHPHQNSDIVDESLVSHDKVAILASAGRQQAGLGE